MRARDELAAIVSIGDEFAIGQSLDTNSKWLSERLTEMGLAVVEHVTVPDDLERIVGTLRRLAGSCGTVVITGGLGPTDDDLTREAMARLAGEPLVEDADALRAIEGWFTRSNREMPPQNRVQALRPRSARMIGNEQGTAPGLHARIGETDIFAMPGPPAEMRPMFEGDVRGRLRRPAGRVVRTRVLHTLGLGESEVAQRLGDLMRRDRNPLVGTTASGGMVSVRVRYEGADAAGEADRLVNETVGEVMRVVGDAVFATDGASLAETVVRRLKAKGESLAVVESCTGGMLGEAVTGVPGSSAAFAGGWITYSNALKERLVGVRSETLRDHGAVSDETAAEMARGGLERSGADHCLAITGIAGPDGGSEEKPVGTVWIALASRGGAEDVRRFLMRGGREQVRAWSVTSSLGMLEMRLRGGPERRLLRQV